MTMEELSCLGLPIPGNELNLLYVNSALDWLAGHTTLDVAGDDFGKVAALPSCAKLFLVKFCEVSGRDVSVASEAVGPMSQSFSSAGSDKLVMGLARQLLKAYLKPNVQFIPCKRRWM